jgi:signal transduction histidine kinase
MGYAGLAKVAIDKKQWNKVLDYNTKASTFLIGNKDYEKEVYYNFYVAYEMQNDFKNSLLYYKQYIAVRDSFLGNDRIKNVDALEAKYQNNEKQARIELLKSEKEIEKSEKERQKIIRNGVVLFSLLIIAVALLVFNRFQLKGKLKQQQALLNERKRIGAELHDDLGAQLSAAHLMMENLRNKSATAADAALIENSLTMLEGSIHHLRNIMDDLKNTTLEQKGFIAATEELVNRITSIKEIKFSLSHTGMEARADRKTEHHLFRITQELINNSLKYAQAKNITLDIVKGTEKLAFMYEDDGIGFNVNAIKRGGGLSNIEQRIHSLNGTVEFDSDLKNGSRVTIHIPVV